MKLLLAGGGTAGHIFPIIAVVREIKRIYSENTSLQEEPIELIYFGPKDVYFNDLMAQEGITIKNIFAGKLRRYFSFQNFVDIFFRAPLGFIQMFFYILFLAPDMVFSKGGYGSLPTVFWSWIFQVPIFMHESDIAPGLTNKILSKFAKEIFTSFPDTEYFSPSKMIQVGNPIRKELTGGSKIDAERIFYLQNNKPIILIVGGSQGSQKINELILTILPEFLANFELIHQAGPKNFKQVQAETEGMLSEEFRAGYHLVPFLEENELKHAYAAADFIISRAGSGSIFEIASYGKPCILIPLPTSAQDHQIKNAMAYAKDGAGIIFEESNLTLHIFLEKLKYMFAHPDEMDIMRKRAMEFARPKAAAVIAEYLLIFSSQ